jgi:DNA replication initiation complex subunit (GINS family)
MSKHLDHISDSLLKDLNEDIHDLNKSTKEMSASVEALKNETGAVFERHFENLQKLFIELSENAGKDIQDETQKQLTQIEKSLGEVVEGKIKSFEKRLESTLADFANNGDTQTKKKSKLIPALLVALVIAISSASFVAGSYLEQSRFDRFIEVLPYLDTNN